jgi:hypothetical protein
MVADWWCGAVKLERNGGMRRQKGSDAAVPVWCGMIVSGGGTASLELMRGSRVLMSKQQHVKGCSTEGEVIFEIL